MRKYFTPHHVIFKQQSTEIPPALFTVLRSFILRVFGSSGLQSDKSSVIKEIVIGVNALYFGRINTFVDIRPQLNWLWCFN